MTGSLKGFASRDPEAVTVYQRAMQSVTLW
jgi:hypothetical protein